jgi:lysophospholipase L1-like esterase
VLAAGRATLLEYRIMKHWVRLALAGAILLTACGPDYDALTNFAVAKGRTVVFLGDSLTAAAGIAENDGFVARLARVLPFEVVNAGMNGDTTADALARIARDVAPHSPTVVVVLIGGNDGLRRLPRDHARRNVGAILDQVAALGAVPVVLGFEMGLFGAGYTAFLEEVAAEKGALYLDDLMDDVLRTPTLRVDQVHPNAEGHRRIAERLEGPLFGLIVALEAR